MGLAFHARLLHNQPVEIDPTRVECGVGRHDVANAERSMWIE